MKKHIQAHPVISFILVTFLFSWTLWLLMILSARGLLPFKFPANFLGSFGPAAGGIVVTSFCYGGTGVKNIFKSMVRVRASTASYLFSFMLIAAIYALAAGTAYLIEPESVRAGNLPAMHEMIIYFFVIAFLGGPLGEETGWRGFLQPELLKRYSPAVASLIIAVIWLIWHLPLFWLEGAAQKGNSIFYFGIAVTAMSFLFTWLFLKTKGSLFMAIMFHTMINYISAYIIPSVLPQSETSKVFGHISTLLILLASILFLVIYFREYTGKKLSVSLA